LVALLNRRAACALAIGKIKRRTRQPVHVPERERDVLQRVAAASAGPLGGAAVQAVFEAIMAQMRLLEERVGAGQ
jgi:chorismate mutase